ncbi:MAG: hypothetical protein KY449_09465 [Proteobacteria bacterium]|nr:hypothetical protein [Pseudomonadota bacterium]
MTKPQGGGASTAPARDPVLDAPRKLVEGEDFYREGPFVVFTAAFHLRRGFCCGSGCRHCPYPKAERQELPPAV